MPHLSSDGSDVALVLQGAMSPDPFVAACLQIGGNGDPAISSQSPEYAISNHHGSAHGRLIWDPDHRRNGQVSPFFSVAPVRFHMKPGECLLSVGTGDYLRTDIAAYRWIEKIQIGAVAASLAPARSIIWDLIEIDFTDASGRTETRRSACLPRATTAIPLRRSLQAEGTPRSPFPRQFAEFSARGRQVVEIKIRGQVTLRANDAGAGPVYPLLAGDLQGRIHVFTDAGVGEIAR
jgi:hypothetical protein